MSKTLKWMGRSGLLIFLLLCSVPSNADLGGICGSLRYMEETVKKETLWLYRLFGSTAKDALVASKDCDYDDPIKIQYCPSALIPHYPTTTTSNMNALYLCLEEPNDPECQRLHLVVVVVVN
jgi:hypothetical protein